MFTITRNKKIAIATVLATAAIGATAGVIASTGEDDELIQAYEVAEDASRFVFDDAPIFDDGMPAYGNSFVTQGYIYELGTFADGGGVNPDGSPTHPEAVLGTWTCEGFFVGDGARTETGAWVVTTQVFDFGELDGDDTIVTHGFELSDIDVAIDRAITGGTGDHAGAAGVHTQIFEGFNAAEGVNLTVSFSAAD